VGAVVTEAVSKVRLLSVSAFACDVLVVLYCAMYNLHPCHGVDVLQNWAATNCVKLFNTSLYRTFLHGAVQNYSALLTQRHIELCTVLYCTLVQ
jgi:hypothetical protein